MRCGVWGPGQARRNQGRSGEDGEPALRVAKNLATTRKGIHAAAPSNGGEFEGAVNEAAADATRAEANAKDEARKSNSLIDNDNAAQGGIHDGFGV